MCTRAAGAKDKLDEVAPASPSDAVSGVKEAASGAKDAVSDSASDAADSAANAVKKGSNPFSGFFGGAPRSCANSKAPACQPLSLLRVVHARRSRQGQGG
jgi:hypothetical protein